MRIVALFIHTSSRPRRQGTQCFMVANETALSRRPSLWPTLYAVGLGNNLFQFASSYGVARTHGYHHCLQHLSAEGEVRWQLEHFFVGPFTKCRTPDVAAEPQLLGELGCARFGFNTPIAPASDGYDVAMGGYFQSFKYWRGYETHVVSALRFQPDFDAYARRYRAEVKRSLNASVIIGIHVRRGEKIEERQSRAASATFLRRAMAHFSETVFRERVGFLVSSDDIEWCLREPELRAPNVHVMHHTHAISSQDVYNERQACGPQHAKGACAGTLAVVRDLAVLVQCDALIVSQGTFGWWAAYLGAYQRQQRDGGATHSRVVYPARSWNRNTSFVQEQVIEEDYFPPDWNTIDDGEP